jgi:hypothetical protein
VEQKYAKVVGFQVVVFAGVHMRHAAVRAKILAGNAKIRHIAEFDTVARRKTSSVNNFQKCQLCEGKLFIFSR